MTHCLKCESGKEKGEVYWTVERKEGERKLCNYKNQKKIIKKYFFKITAQNGLAQSAGGTEFKYPRTKIRRLKKTEQNFNLKNIKVKIKENILKLNSLKFIPEKRNHTSMKIILK